MCLSCDSNSPNLASSCICAVSIVAFRVWCSTHFMKGAIVYRVPWLYGAAASLFRWWCVLFDICRIWCKSTKTSHCKVMSGWVSQLTVCVSIKLSGADSVRFLWDITHSHNVIFASRMGHVLTSVVFLVLLRADEFYGFWCDGARVRDAKCL